MSAQGSSLTGEAPTPVSRHDFAVGLALGLASVLAWGAYSVAARHGLDGGLDAWDLTAIRFATAGLITAPILLRHGVRDLGGVGWPRGIVLALGAGPLFAWLYTRGLEITPFAHGPVISPSVVTLGTLGLSAWLLGDRPTRNQLVGVAVVLVGLVLVASGRADGHGLGAPSAGDAMFLASGVLWATYAVNLRRWKVPPLLATAIASSLGGVVVVPLYLLTGDLGRLFAHPWAVAEQAVFQGLLASVLATVLFSASVARLGAGRAGIFPSLTPSVAVLLAIPTLGIMPTVQQTVGICLATLGLTFAIGLLGHRHPSEQHR